MLSAYVTRVTVNQYLAECCVGIWIFAFNSPLPDRCHSETDTAEEAHYIHTDVSAEDAAAARAEQGHTTAEQLSDRVHIQEQQHGNTLFQGKVLVLCLAYEPIIGLLL